MKMDVFSANVDRKSAWSAVLLSIQAKLVCSKLMRSIKITSKVKETLRIVLTVALQQTNILVATE